MERLVDLAKMIRSKNSGPFLITLDVLFSEEKNYVWIFNMNYLYLKTSLKMLTRDSRNT